MDRQPVAAVAKSQRDTILKSKVLVHSLVEEEGDHHHRHPSCCEPRAEPNAEDGNLQPDEDSGDNQEQMDLNDGERWE